MLVSDYTGQARLQGFHDVGLAIFDMSADDLMEINVRTFPGSMDNFIKRLVLDK